MIYHGCGNATTIFEDFIEMGLDSYNPLEAKSGLDVVELRRKYGHRMGFCGNMDVLTWANAPMEELRRHVLRKLNAAKGGGYIFQSDHSVPEQCLGRALPVRRRACSRHRARIRSSSASSTSRSRGMRRP